MLISIWGCEGLVKLELLLNNTLLASHDFAHFGYYTYLSHCILIWNFWGHSKTRLDYEFCDNEVWPKHKLTAFLILAIFCFPIEPILCWIACQGIHPLGMKMLHIDQALKYKKNKNVRNRMMDMDLEKFMIQVSILNTLKCFGFIFLFKR